METVNQEIKPSENEAFWKHHFQILKSTGMRRSQYCHQHNLNYDRFGYWISRWNKLKKNNNELVGIKIKPELPSSEIKILCTITFSNGACLKIHDSTALEFILERYR